MLRQIVSASLAMTACAILMPIKANAATLTVSPDGTVQKNTGDTVEFKFLLKPDSSRNRLRFLSLQYGHDATELTPIGELTSEENLGTIILKLLFRVEKPDKEGGSDVYDVIVRYMENGAFRTTPSASGANIVPVPEPLTIFGTATALGLGALFKRKSSKKTVS